MAEFMSKISEIKASLRKYVSMEEEIKEMERDFKVIQPRKVSRYIPGNRGKKRNLTHKDVYSVRSEAVEQENVKDNAQSSAGHPLL